MTHAGRRGRRATLPRLPSCAHHGFTVIELLVASALALGALALLAPLMRHAGDASRTLPATADIDQRTRAAATMVERVLMRAGEGFGAGSYSGPSDCERPSRVSASPPNHCRAMRRSRRSPTASPCGDPTDRSRASG